MTVRDLVLVAYDQTDTQGVADSVVKYLRRDHGYEVLVGGPGHGRELAEVDPAVLERARFFLELDAVSGRLYHAQGLERLRCPKLAWFVDSHKKPHFHQGIAPDFDVVFFTMWGWSGLFAERGRWLPVHYDADWIGPRDAVQPRFDVGFVGSRPRERTRVLQEIAQRHGLTLLLETTTGPREKELTADLYAQCRIVFNQHVANDLNFRMVEAPACRRLLVTDAQRNGQYELFRDREHVVYYKDDQDLEAVLLHYLRHDEERERIAAAGHALVSRLHTTAARVQAMVAVAEDMVRDRGGAPRAVAQKSSVAATHKARLLVLAGELDQGATGQVLGLSNALIAGGAEVIVLGLATPEVPIPGAQVHVARGPRLPRLVGASRARGLLENVPLLDAAKELLTGAGAPYTGVVALRAEHALAARLLGLPFVVVAGPEVPDTDDVLELRDATAILATSAPVREALVRLDPGLVPRIELAPNASQHAEGLAAGLAVLALRAFLASEPAAPPAPAPAQRAADVRDDRDYMLCGKDQRATNGGRERQAVLDVSIGLVCCDRPDVLEVTLETTRASLVASPLRLEWLAFDNGSREPVRRVLEDSALDVVLRAGRNRGLAPALDALYGVARGRYVLTLEDDWACLSATHGWLALAVRILDTQSDVGVVRLRRVDDGQCGHFKRHRPEVALRHHPWTVEPFPHDVVETRELDGERFYVAAAEWANWTHNPTLCRREVRDWLGPVSAYLPDPRDHRPRDGHPGLEGAIDLRWRGGPWKVAKLLDGPFTHIGEQSALVEAS